MTLQTARKLLRREKFYETLIVILFSACVLGAIVCSIAVGIKFANDLPADTFQALGLILMATMFLLLFIGKWYADGLLTGSAMKELQEEANRVVQKDLEETIKEERRLILVEYEYKTSLDYLVSKKDDIKRLLEAPKEPKRPQPITLEEFFSMNNVCIHVHSHSQANKLLEEFHRMGKHWQSGDSYATITFYSVEGDQTCYSNDGQYCQLSWYVENGYTIYDFSDIKFKELKPIDWEEEKK